MKKDITKDNLIFQIWTRPTETLNFIIANCPDKYVTLFIVLGGMTNSIDQTLSRSSNTDSLIQVLGIATVIGLLLGWISYYFYAYVLSITGEWLDGKSQPKEFRTIIGWALIPIICTLPISLSQIIIFGDVSVIEYYENENVVLTILYYSFLFLEMVLSLWSLMILIKGIMIIQGFGVGKSILNMIMPGLLIFIPIFLIAWILQLF